MNEEIHMMDEPAATDGPAVAVTSCPPVPAGGSGTPAAAGPVVARGPALGRVWRWFRQGNAPLAVLFAAGMVSVYLLSLRGGPAVASAQEQAEETHVQTVLTEWRARYERSKTRPGSGALAERFYYETKQRQIPLGRQVGNPFVFKTPQGGAPEPVASPEPQVGTAAATSYADALTAAKQLKLQSVLAGPHGAMAMISNNILTEGQVISGWTIRKIEPERVMLEWQDKTYELMIH